MKVLQNHLRNTFLAGIFAVVPLVLTIFIIYKVYDWSSQFSNYLLGEAMPFIGVVLAISIIYLTGLIATMSLGKMIIGAIDSVLSKVPGLRQIYTAWKHIALTPGGTEGTFSHVVLIPDEMGVAGLLGFTSLRPIENSMNILAVFVPASPNPVSGRLYFINRDKCVLLSLTTEEAFKIILSTGNYVPAEIGQAVQDSVVERKAADRSRV
jgi:uncharacterized membrane protein